MAMPGTGSAPLGAPDISAASWAMVTTLGVVWGASFLLVELALVGITPFWLAASRILLGAAATSVIWRLRGGRFYLSGARVSWLLLTTISAMSTALPFMALSWGQQYVTAGFAGVSMAAVALIVLPLAHVLVPGERMTPRKVLGFLIGFAGVVVLMGPEAFRASGVQGEGMGRIACLAAAACYAVSSVLMRRLPAVDPVGLSAVTLWIGGVLVTAAAVWREGVPPLPPDSVIWVIVTLGLVQTALANHMRILVIRTAGPTFMSLVNYQVPVWSVVMGAVFLGETWEASLVAAMALILVGVGLSQWRALGRLFRSGAPENPA